MEDKEGGGGMIGLLVLTEYCLPCRVILSSPVLTCMRCIEMTMDVRTE